MNCKSICILIVLLSLTVTACDTSRKKDVRIEYKSDFLIDTCCALSSISMECNLKTTSLLRLENRLLAFGDYDRVRIYSYPDLKFIRIQQLQRNIGKTVVGNELLLESKGKVNRYRLDEQDSLIPCGAFEVLAVPFSISVKSLGKERYVFADNYDLDGTSEFHIVNMKTGEWKSGGEYPESPARFKRLRNFKEAYFHTLNTKPDGTAFVVAYSNIRRVHIYDDSGKLLHAVKLDYVPNDNLVDPNRRKTYWYIQNAVTTDKYIYLVNPEQQLPPPKNYSEIVVLDWEGNLKIRYRLNKFVVGIVVDEDRKAIIGCCNKSGKGSFFKLDILID